MFRDTKSGRSVKHFGIGSTIKTGNIDAYLVVLVEQNTVGLIDLKTFDLCAHKVKVADFNYLSEEEARDLVSKTPFAVSDFDFNPKGFK